MLDLIKHPRRYTKFYLGLVGAIITWAIATFPDSRDVQVYGSLISALLTGGAVYQGTNQKDYER